MSNASGAKYGGGPSTSDSGASRAPPPPAATKPVFMPTRTGGSLLASRPKPAAPTNTDNDGWGDTFGGDYESYGGTASSTNFSMTAEPSTSALTVEDTAQTVTGKRKGN